MEEAVAGSIARQRRSGTGRGARREDHAHRTGGSSGGKGPEESRGRPTGAVGEREGRKKQAARRMAYGSRAREGRSGRQPQRDVSRVKQARGNGSRVTTRRHGDGNGQEGRRVSGNTRERRAESSWRAGPGLAPLRRGLSVHEWPERAWNELGKRGGMGDRGEGINKGTLVYITDSLGVRDVYATNGEGAIATIQPLAVLVNKGAASAVSASEILAGALKDNNRALVFRTFGKGKIQSVFELSDGSGLAVTIARYETPDHTDIDKVGILPDYPLPDAVPMDPDQFCQCLCPGSPSNAQVSNGSSNGAITSNGAASGAAIFEYQDAAAPPCSLPSSLLFPRSPLAK
ncbi:unnamed protein product [Closterium sp. Naga37s-1]|nr:unnamed protein product [Closterium sp. Naga37s-1]